MYKLLRYSIVVGSHCGVPGNERADELASYALTLPCFMCNLIVHVLVMLLYSTTADKSKRRGVLAQSYDCHGLLT